jgi:hypothetical protein
MTAKFHMDPIWLNHLQQSHAQYDAQGGVYFRTTQEEIHAAATQNVLAVLQGQGVIRASGDDAEAFLQGQFSNDVKALNINQAQLTAWCSPKGRVLALLLLLRDESGYNLLLPRAIIANTLKRMRLFVLRSKVVLEDVSDQFVCLGCAGAGIEQHLQQHFGAVPAAYRSQQLAGVQLTRLPGCRPRFVIMGSVPAMINAWPSLSPSLSLVGDAAWQWLDIESGMPAVLPGSVDEFVPQMLNLEILDAVNFKKGCYPGQEIVARTHYLGKLKRRLYKLHSADATLPPTGTDIYNAHGDAQSIGKVILAQPAPSQGTDLLAVLQMESAPAGELHLSHLSGPALQVQTLPYPFEPKTP